jgi:Protein of unknown function (DUF3551)
MKTVIRLTVVAASLALSSIFGPPTARASGDEPWCALTSLGEGAQAWNCEYETVEECLPSVVAGNRGSCVQNPYYRPPPASASVPGNDPTNTTSGSVEKSKSQKNAK